ncbi:MFS transporter [Aliiglaciecola aliphaticivorans]
MINSKSTPNPTNESKPIGNAFMQWRARNIGIFVFVIAILSSTLTNMDQSLFSYVLPDIMGTFAFSLNDTGSIISISFLAAMIIAPIAGVLADRWSHRWMLLICMGLSAILVGLQGLATSQQGFIILRALSFGLSAALVPIIASMVANYSSDKNRTWFISLLQCGYPFGWFFASLVVALLLDNGWRMIFMMGFIVAPLVLLFTLSLPNNPKLSDDDASAQNTSSIKDIFSGSFRFTALAFCAAFFCYGLASGAKIFYLPTFFQVARGYSGEMAALIMGTLQVVGIVGYLLSAYISRRYLSLRATTLTFATLGAIMLVIAIWLPQSQWQDLIVFSIMAIFVNGTASIAIVFLMNQSHPKLRGSTMGICGSACVNAGFLVSPLVTTRLVEFMGWHWMYTIFVGSGLIASGLFFFLAGKHKVNHEMTNPIETLTAEPAN